MSNHDPESTRCAEFLAQFSSAEQHQLMTWVETLISGGEVFVPENHPLFNAFDSLAKYVGHQIDHLPHARENG